MKSTASRDQLLKAFKLARIQRLSFEQALEIPCLAIALSNTALAIEKKRLKRSSRARVDIKRIAAGDID